MTAEGVERRPAVRFRAVAFGDLTGREVHDVLGLRHDVFVVEQGIHSVPDIDGLDPDAVHVLGETDDGVLVAVARVWLGREPAEIGRVVVRRDARGRGLGTRLMRHAESVLGSRTASVHAQAHLEAWYVRLGWTRRGEPFDEGGVPHVRLDREAGATA